MGSILDKLEKERPFFHNDGKDGITSWNSNTNLLREIEKIIQAEMKTLEIGSGYSTVVFLNKGCIHTSITPIPDESARISEYCRKIGITNERATFLTGFSHDILSTLQKESFDLIFIDGAHRFPFPIIDWFFCAMLLKNNGIIIIDDTDIISCHVLLKFLSNDPHWEIIKVYENFGIFRKKGNHDYYFDWVGQPFSKIKISDPNDLIESLYRKKDR
jgi:hypothetical protein